MNLDEIKAAQPADAAPALTDSIYEQTAGNEPRSFTLEQLIAFLAAQGLGGVPTTQFVMADTTLDVDSHGAVFAIAVAATLTIDPAVPVGWGCWIDTRGNPAPAATILLPAGWTSAPIPPTIANTTGYLTRLPDNAGVAQMAFVPVRSVAAHVANADATSLATLATGVDALRDALVAAGLMASA